MATYNYKHINGAATTVVSSVPAKLAKITINTTSGGAITVYDEAAGAVVGSEIAIFPTSADVGTYKYDVETKKGIVIVTEGTGDITVSFGRN